MALAAGFAVAAILGTSHATVPALGFSDNAPFTQPRFISPAAFALRLARTGATVDRIELDWGYAQPTAPTAGSDGYSADYLARFDAVYRAALARGLRLIIIPMDAPDWARTQAARDACGPGAAAAPNLCISPPSPVHLGDYEDLLRMVASRYPDALAIEVWNEPNLAAFWHPAANMVDYGVLLRHAYTTIKAVAPEMTVISGGLSNVAATGAGNVSMPDALATIYGTAGASSLDGIAFHSYPCPTDHPRLARLLSDARAVRAIRDGYGDDGKPLWLTETGATTSADSFANCGSHYGLAEQGSIDAAAVRWARCQPDLEAATVVSLYEMSPRKDGVTWSPSPGDPEQGFGLLAWARDEITDRYAFRKKPGYAPVVNATTRPVRC